MESWRRLDQADSDEARALLATCCGATRWVDEMLARRPFGSRHALLTAAHDVWWSLGPDDWREAFSHHPKIGDRDAPGTRSTRNSRGTDVPRRATVRTLSEREQAGVAGAPAAVLDALADGNQVYERRFGYIFIVCATGKSAQQMLALLRVRLDNDPAVELRIAAGEQEKITAIRLDALAD